MVRRMIGTQIPVIQYTVDDWAWEPLGRSLR